MSLYVYDRPVTGTAFVGRELLLRGLVRGVEQGRAIALFGGPRMGRTSALLHLVETLHLHWLRNPKDAKTVPVVVDFTPVLTTGPKAAAKLLWEQLVASVVHPRVYGNAPPPRVPEPKFVRADDPWQLFRESASALWSTLSGTAGWCRWALLVDHAELLCTRELEGTALSLLALLRDKEQSAPSAAVLATGRALRERMQERGSPFAALRPIYLSLLNDAEAEHLVRLAFREVTPAELEAICRVTGKHPYLLQRLLAALEAMGLHAGVDQALETMRDEVAVLGERLWAELDMGRGVTYRGAYAAPEHALFQFVIDYGRELQLKTAERELGIKPLKEYAELLEYCGLVEKRLRGDQVYLRAPVEALNAWYGERVRR